MTINIQSVHMSNSESLCDHVTKKLENLHKKYNWLIGAEVHFEVEHNDKEKGKICKIEISAPGPRIFATSNAQNYGNAVKKAIKDLEVQLKKRKKLFVHQ